MDILTLIPSVYDIFTAIGGFATVWGTVAIGKRFVASWRAAGADKDARIEALEQGMRAMADLLDARTAPPPDAPKGAIG